MLPDILAPPEDGTNKLVGRFSHRIREIAVQRMVGEQARLDVGGQHQPGRRKLGREGRRVGELVAVPVEHVTLRTDAGVAT